MPSQNPVDPLAGGSMSPPREAGRPSGGGERACLLGVAGGALLASLCCLVPLALLAFGASAAAAGAFAVFKPYRPYFLALTLALLATAWWLVFQRRRFACAGTAPGEAARSVGGSWFPRYPALWAASALVLAVLALPYVLAALGADPPGLPGPGVSPVGRTAQEVGRRVVTLRVEGMTCPSCPLIVRKALERVPGVAAAEVTLEPPRAVVTLTDPRLGAEILIRAVRAAGYDATLAR